MNIEDMTIKEIRETAARLNELLAAIDGSPAKEADEVEPVEEEEVETVEEEPEDARIVPLVRVSESVGIGMSAMYRFIEDGRISSAMRIRGRRPSWFMRYTEYEVLDEARAYADIEDMTGRARTNFIMRKFAELKGASNA